VAVVVLIPSAEHCIETVAKQEYRRCVRACLRSERPQPEFGARLEILRRFLEQSDFPRLRRKSEPLLRTGQPIRFVLEGDGERVRWRMEGENREQNWRWLANPLERSNP
jgi:hypothetical protein